MSKENITLSETILLRLNASDMAVHRKLNGHREECADNGNLHGGYYFSTIPQNFDDEFAKQVTDLYETLLNMDIKLSETNTVRKQIVDYIEAAKLSVQRERLNVEENQLRGRELFSLTKVNAAIATGHSQLQGKIKSDNKLTKTQYRVAIISVFGTVVLTLFVEHIIIPLIKKFI